MHKIIKTCLLGSQPQNSVSQNIGFLLLRLFVGIALCTIFEKFFPRNGVWGPQEWFIQDAAEMGFPFPAFFAWVAVLAEFFGGILLILGLFTRPAALLNVFVTFTATFIYHKGAISGAGLVSFSFLIMCLCILLVGPGKLSLDYLLTRQSSRKLIGLSVGILLFLCFCSTASLAETHFVPAQTQELTADSARVRFYIKNNRLLPKKVTLIIYQPPQVGNNTLVKWFLPWQKMKFDLPVASKLYIATDSQVNTVMQGKRIDMDKPFLQVTATMSDTTVQLNRRE